jgi:retron-type reverse transcriptase
MEADDIVNQFYLLQKAGWLFDPSEVDPPEIWDAAVNKMYYTFYIKKKYGIEKRRINSPNRELKAIQGLIYRHILQKVPLPDCVHGFRKGYSIRSNAITHAGKKYIYVLDMKDFFPGITRGRVKAMFTGLGLSAHHAEGLSKLCTYNQVLPQGAVTSPAISNIVFSPVDIAILKLCSGKGIAYSRYADDLSFSGNDRKLLLDTVRLARGCIISGGFQINGRKNRLMSGRGAKMVTGLRLNAGKPSIGNRRKKLLRAKIYHWLVYGNHAEAAYIHGSLAFLKSAEPDTWERFMAYINFLKTSKPETNEPPQGKPCGIWNVEQFPDRRLVREEIYYTVWFNTKFL